MKRLVINDVISHSGKNAHPRIMLTAKDFALIAESDDPIYVNGRQSLIEEARAILDEPLLEHVIPDGIRLLAVSRRMLARSLKLGMAYRITGDRVYAERLLRELLNVCAFKDWNPRHFLDVGEMCNAVGIAYDWIYECMSQDERATVRRALKEKGFEQVMDDYLDRERSRTYRWYQDDPGDNWKFVCNGGITVAALAICDEDDVDTDYLSDIFGYAFDNSYRAVRDMYLPDGSYVEGFTYWTYATEYLAYYTSALVSACGTDYGLTDYEPVRNSVYYLKGISSGRFTCFNFGDAYETNLLSAVFSWVGNNYGAADIVSMRSEYLTKYPSETSVLDLLWYKPTESKNIAPLPLDFGEVGATNAAFRSDWTEESLYGAIHFGKNDVCHGHADNGSFIIEHGGKRFVSDLGSDEYNVKNYRRVYRYRAEGHNTIVINPNEDCGQDNACECYIERFVKEGEGGSFAVCDISSAYPGRQVLRGMMMTKARDAIVICDEMTLDSDDTYYWFAHTKADVAICDDGASAILTIDGVRLWVGVLSGARLEVGAADYLLPGMVQEGQLDNSKYSRLYIRGKGSVRLTVAFMPLADGKDVPDNIPEVKSISEW